MPDVVVRLLEVPLQRASVERERDDRVGEEIDPRSLRAVAERIPHWHVEQPELRIDGGRFPDPASVSLAANPRGTRNVPALIPFVLGNRVETPFDLSGLGVNGQHVAAGNVTLASSTADVERAVVILRRGREPVSDADRGFDVLVSSGQHVHEDARLSALAEALNGLPALRVKREEKRAAGRVDDAVGVDGAAIAEDVALTGSSANEIG